MMCNVYGWTKRAVIVALALAVIAGFTPSANASLVALVTVSMEFYDLAMNPIATVNQGEQFKFRVHVVGPETGIKWGYVDVSVNPTDAGFDEVSTTLHSALTRYNDAGVFDKAAMPQYDDFGGLTLSDGYCAAPVGDYLYEGICTANNMLGWMTFTTSEGYYPNVPAPFAYSNGDHISADDVLWGGGGINVVPEPITAGILALGGLVFVRRRRK